LGDEMAVGKHKALVVTTVFDQVQEILSQNTKSSSIEGLFPLKGFVTCHNCGKYFTGYQVKKKQKADGTYRIKKSQPIYYKCKCSNISGSKMHDIFSQVLRDICLEDHLVIPFQQILEETSINLSADLIKKRVLTKRKITEQSHFVEKLEVHYLNGDIDTETYKKHKAISGNKLAELKKNLSSSADLSNPSLFIKKSMPYMTRLHSILQESMIFEKRKIQE
jgi:hypothetical protein